MFYVSTIIHSFFFIRFCSAVYAQETRYDVVIKNDTVIIHQDTLVVGYTGLEDVLSRSQIDSLRHPSIYHWDGICDSGTEYHYTVKNKYSKSVYSSNSQITFILKTISLKNINELSLSLGNQVVEDKLLQEDILQLGFKKEKKYKPKNSKSTYIKEGIHLRCIESSDSISIQSIHIHPKSWDRHVKLKSLEGKVCNNKGEPLPGVLFLAYNQSDTLKYYETSDFDGKYFFEIDSIRKIDIFNFNYESQTINVLGTKDQTINLKLKKKIHYLPDLVVTKKGEIRIDSICYLDQFPKLRDSSKINVWFGCDYSNFNPLIYRIPSVTGGIKHCYEQLVSNLSRKNKLRRCTAKVNLVIYKNGLTQLQNVVCDDKINKELLARYIFDAFKWTPARWRGKPINSDWSLKIIFE